MTSKVARIRPLVIQTNIPTPTVSLVNTVAPSPVAMVVTVVTPTVVLV